MGGINYYLMLPVILIYLVLINIITFAAYGLDKRKAKRNQWRTPEATLIGLAIIGGSIGAALGMQVWRHKTHHKKFTLGVPACLIVHFFIALYFCGEYCMKAIPN